MRKMSEKKGTKRELSNSSSDEVEEESQNIEKDLESESEFDCDKWDDDCKIIDLKPVKSIVGYHLLITNSQDTDEKHSKKSKISLEVNSKLLHTNYKDNFKTHWTNNQSINNDGTELITKPFKVCVINNFLNNQCFLNNLREEFNDIDWNLRSMDLYEFSQSKDLKYLTNHPNINLIYNLLQNDVKKWVAEVTGLNLTHISATCSLYSNTDYLLVHDDQREDRMVAFILYLTYKDGWDESKGGSLQLLNKDNEGHPSEVVRNIFPINNQFVFFPVANDSYHQVAEVTSLYDSRLSINGWFHTEVPPTYETPEFKPYPDGLYGEKHCKPIDFDSDLSSWITEEYLEGDIVQEVQEYFEEHSEISLKQFLREEPFNELYEILKSDILNWVRIGPPNRYCYEVVKIDNLPVVLDRFLRLFQSKQMFSQLQRFTGLEFNENSSMKFELQRWTPGCYSLLGDYDWYDHKQLDLVFYFGVKNINDVIGGRTLYVTTDEQIQDALITLEPEDNNLNIIYRDTARFTKYFSKLSRCDCFYTLMCSYTE